MSEGMSEGLGAGAGDTGWRFLVEPAALVRAFLKHPPQGFPVALSASGTPFFAAPLDLLTTVEDGLRRRISAWPLYRIWGRWLRLRGCFAGSTVSEYLPLGGAGLAAEAQVRELLETAAQRPELARHELLVIKDLPQQSPLLGEADNQHAEALAQALAGAGFVLLQGQALAWVPIDFESIEAYLAALSSGRRRDLRRKLRSRADLDLEQWSTGDPRLADAALRAEIYQLYLNVYAQSEIHFDLLSQDYFDALLQDGTLPGRLFLYRAEGRLIGWNLLFEQEGLLIDKTIGLLYPQARQHNLYFVSWMVNLEYALARGLRAYVAGWTDPQVKAALGARFSLTRHAVRPRRAWLRWALRRLAPLFEGDHAWHSQAQSR